MLVMLIQPLIGIVLIYPLWRICRKLGRNPVLSLVAIVPFVGVMTVAVVLALGRWPSFDETIVRNSASR